MGEIKTNQEGLNLIKEAERLRLKAYSCPAGKPTIGYGHTKNVFIGMDCTEGEAEEWLTQDICHVEHLIDAYVKVPLTENQLSALVSFVFNVGGWNFRSSTLLRRLNEGKYDEVPFQMRRWIYARVHGEKVVLPGLVTRRDKEAELWSRRSSTQPEEEGV